METKQTERGFNYTNFTDSYGVDCSIQVSSIVADESYVWLGANDIGLKYFKAYEGWKDVELTNTIKEHYVANNRMHLSQSKVKEMLPTLLAFADTGELKDATDYDVLIAALNMIGAVYNTKIEEGYKYILLSRGDVFFEFTPEGKMASCP